MEIKKSPKANLERKRLLFFQMGLIVALSLSLLGFEWKSYELSLIPQGERIVEDIPEELVQITKHLVKPPLPKPPTRTTILQIVTNDIEPDDFIIVDAGFNEEDENEYYFPELDPEEEEIIEDEPHIFVQNYPSYPGGENERVRFLRANIRYPQLARERQIQGTVHLSFVVEKDGSITNVSVERGIGGGCDAEAVRVVKMMPKWNPGKQWGKAVRVRYNMPIKFSLR